MRKKVRSDKIRKRQARQSRVRKKMGNSDRTWLTVYRSARHIYAQLVDSESGRTLVSVSTRSRAVMGDSAATGNVEGAKRVGQAIAQAAKEKNVGKVVLNRNGFLYHGRVKALADAAREAGLEL